MNREREGFAPLGGFRLMLNNPTSSLSPALSSAVLDVHAVGAPRASRSGALGNRVSRTASWASGLGRREQSDTDGAMVPVLRAMAEPLVAQPGMDTATPRADVVVVVP
jgi:hypothetical protein